MVETGGKYYFWINFFFDLLQISAIQYLNGVMAGGIA